MANSEELLAQNDIAAYVYVATKSAVEALASSDSPVACAFGVAPADASSLPCLTVVPLNANPVEKRYLDGSFVANCAFAFVLRTLETSEEGLLEVRSFLEKVVKQLEAGFPIGEGRQLWVVSAVNGRISNGFNVDSLNRISSVSMQPSWPPDCYARGKPWLRRRARARESRPKRFGKTQSSNNVIDV